MTRIQIAGAAVIALMVIALVVDERSALDQSGDQSLLPGLAGELASLDRVQVRGLDHSVELVRRDNIWRVAERYDYPAKFEQLSDLLDQLSQAKLIERKTARVESHDSLDVVVGPQSRGHRIVFPGLDLEPLIIGRTATLRSGTFVRLGEEAQVWLADQTVEITADPALWLDSQMLTIPESQILSMAAFAGQGAALFEVNRDPASGELNLTNLPEGRTLRYGTALTPNFTVIGQLQLLDVAQRVPLRWEGAARRVYRLVDGRRVTVQTAADAGDFWIQVQVGQEDEQVASLDGTDVFVNITAVQQETFDFKVSQRTFTDLTADLEQFLKPLEEPTQ